MAGPGLRVRAGPVGKKELFLEPFFFQRSKISTAIKLEGGGGLGLNGSAIKKRFFCGFPKRRPKILKI